MLYVYIEEEFEDTKGVIRIRTSKKNRKHNGQKKKYKNTNNDLQSNCSDNVVFFVFHFNAHLYMYVYMCVCVCVCVCV